MKAIMGIRAVAASTAAAAIVMVAPLGAQGGEARTIPSPRDSVIQTISGARVKVDYGRPSKRGREIFGGLVPWNEVWRTGANEATGLVTSKTLQIGGVTVPAGSYTLYTLPSKSGWKLIINKQTGQWGTEYDEKQDFARVDLRVESMPKPVEQFAIKLEPQGKGGILRLAWDTTQASVPIVVK